MPAAIILISYFGSLLLSLGWLLLQRNGLRQALPNHRSSHTVPTPQGGGIAIAVVGIATLCFLSLGTGLMTQFVLLMPLCLAALTGYWDDFHGLSGRWKLGLIALSVLPLVYFTAVTTTMPVTGVAFFALLVLLFLGLIWVVNLTNFMDGINGLAILQTLFMLLTLWWFREDFVLLPMMSIWLLCLSAACLAFLPFNFPTAKLFLGDTGSLFLGILMAWILILMLNHANGLWVFLTLFAMFWVDTTVTLIRRLLRRKSIFEAHREHAYQHLANERWHSHTKATLFILLINVVWLLPMSFIVLHSMQPLLWTAVALLPVFIYTIMLNAGLPIKNNKSVS